MQDELAEALTEYYRKKVANKELAPGWTPSFQTWLNAVTKGYDRDGNHPKLPSLWERFGKKQR